MKKVLFIASVGMHIKSFHIPYIKWFKDRGYCVHVAMNDIVELPYVDKVHEIKFQRSPFSLYNIWAYFELKKIIDDEKFDIVTTHTPTPSALARLASINTRKNNKTKLFYTAHGFHFYKGASVSNWAIFFPIEMILTRFTDALITINNEDYNILNRYGSKKCRYYILPGIGVDKNKFSAVSDVNNKLKLRMSLLGFSPDSIVLTYVARIENDKGHKFIIDIVKKHRHLFNNIKILFVGDGFLRKSLEKIVYSNDLSEVILFLGYREDICNIFRASDFCLSASSREGFGINIVEGMLCGLPVIATKNRGHNTILDNKCGFLFNLGDEEEFIKIIKLIKHCHIGELYQEKSQRARVRGMDFELQKSLKTFGDIYSDFFNGYCG